MTFEQKIIATLVIGVIGAALTFTRRYKNENHMAGIGISGWTIFIIVCLWW